MAKKKKDDSVGIPEWVLTYGDLMSLLLCFFILLAAFSELKQPREYKKVMDSIKEALGVAGGVGTINVPMNPSNTNANPVTSERANLRGDEPSRSKQNRPNVTGREDTVSKIHEGLRFVVGGSLLFSPGQSELTEQHRTKLKFDVAPKIRDINYAVVIRGHAWGESDLRSGLGLRELAYRRADAVYRYLVDECGVRDLILRVEAVGSAEPRSVDSGTAEHDPENRRVEVFRTEASVDELHPDPAGTGRAGS
ncbi:MAG: flagellar motor protein MotB [Planctomycetota bacterium]